VTTRPTLARRATAEAIGTFALVFAGCGAVVTNAQRHGALGVVGIGLVFFLVLLAAIGTLGHVSGAHFNPGVSLSFFLTRHLPARDLGAYWAAQFTGAITAALLLLVIWPGHPADLGATVPTIAVGRALVVEVILTALLMLVIMSVATDTRAVGAPAAIAIAAAVGLAAIAFGPLTGASLNTARSFGPALASGQWHDFWIYVVGPLCGAPLGALAYQFVRGEPPQRPVLASEHEHEHEQEQEQNDGHSTVRLPA
jgi:aquaporin NIP